MESSVTAKLTALYPSYRWQLVRDGKDLIIRTPDERCHGVAWVDRPTVDEAVIAGGALVRWAETGEFSYG